MCLNKHMNILAICRLRTRSTYFLQSLCNYYNLTNRNESYFEIPSSYSCSLQYINPYPIFFQRHLEKWAKYSKKLHNQTLYNIERGNFGIKLFSKMISSHPVFLNESQFDQIQIVSDIEKVFEFNLYDSIYFLDRNLLDSVASYVYSLQVGKSLYKTVIKNKSVEFTNNLYPSVNSYILDCIIQQKIRTVLDNKNFSYTYLDYHDIPEFLRSYDQNNQPNLPVDTKFDYTKLITNYEELVRYTNNIYSILQKTIAL